MAGIAVRMRWKQTVAPMPLVKMPGPREMPDTPSVLGRLRAVLLALQPRAAKRFDAGAQGFEDIDLLAERARSARPAPLGLKGEQIRDVRVPGVGTMLHRVHSTPAARPATFAGVRRTFAVDFGDP